MTIGSTYSHPADIAATLADTPPGWSARFPNPPDLCFDYRRLLEQVGGIARVQRAELPQRIIDAYKTAHWETSCKVYAPLKKSFLQRNRLIPQILVTDSFIHDVYAYGYNDHYVQDCILLSYTWEDDATKLASFSDEQLVHKCVQELDRILLRCTNIQAPISPYVDTRNARVQRWMTDRNALGCAKLYRAGTYYDAVSLMRYSREHAQHSGLYLAGESFSVDAGWTEPCLRTAIDAVINLCNNTQALFNGGFSMALYPHYRVQPRASWRGPFLQA